MKAPIGEDCTQHWIGGCVVVVVEVVVLVVVGGAVVVVVEVVVVAEQSNRSPDGFTAPMPADAWGVLS